MKKQLLPLVITILSLNCYAQISFEKGYYINNADQRVDCQIKNIDWKNNPTTFEYKLSEDTAPKTATIKSVKEFGIYNISKYKRYRVKLDRSSKNVNRLSTKKDPVFKEEELFLKVLVEGKAKLYFFEEGNLRRFFYNTDTSEVRQLIFKTYLTPENRIGENNGFKQQLWNHLKCPTISMDNVKDVAYKKKSLVNFFVKYNECQNVEFTNFEKTQKGDLFNLTLRPGFNISSLVVQYYGFLDVTTVDFGNELGFRFGVETEFIMPFNKNKWAIILEPTYQYFKSEKELPGQRAEVNYRSIELPIGIRHYFFLNNNAKIFTNGSLVFDLANNSTMDFIPGGSLEIATRTNLAFGVGYKHNDRYSIELRYQTSREILSNYLFWASDYTTLSILFGYSMF